MAINNIQNVNKRDKNIYMVMHKPTSTDCLGAKSTIIGSFTIYFDLIYISIQWMTLGFVGSLRRWLIVGEEI